MTECRAVSNRVVDVYGRFRSIEWSAGPIGSHKHVFQAVCRRNEAVYLATVAAIVRADRQEPTTMRRAIIARLHSVKS